MEYTIIRQTHLRRQEKSSRDPAEKYRIATQVRTAEPNPLVAQMSMESVISLRWEMAETTKRVCELEQQLEDIRQCGPPSIAVISDLHPAPFEVTKPIYVSLEADTEGYVATFCDADISVSGDTPGDAVDNLRDTIVDIYEDLAAEKPERLGPGPLRQLDTLRRFLNAREDRS